MMQVPQSITLTNGHSNSNQSSRSQSFYSNPTENVHYQMDIPDKLTGWFTLRLTFLQAVFKIYLNDSSDIPFLVNQGQFVIVLCV